MTLFPSWQDTFLALHRASTLEELWTVLLVPHGIRSSSAWEEPFALFRHFHAADSEHAATTVALLSTDHRWRRGVNRLIGQLAGSDVLDDVARDQVSDWFLGDALVVSAPRRWFPEPFLVELSATPDPPAPTPQLTVADRSRADERARVTVQRSIWPPLRRWAACHAVERSPARWAAVLTHAGVLATQDGTAMAAGVMDAAAAIEQGERIDAVEAGLAWGSGTVRLAARPRLAELLGGDVAMQRALGDPSAKVRARAAKAALRLPLTPADSRGGSDIEAEVDPSIRPGLRAHRLADAVRHLRHGHVLERATPEWRLSSDVVQISSRACE